MDATEFVKAIKITVRDSAINGCISLLTKVPGRNPNQELVSASMWYNNLSDHDQNMVQYVARMATDESVFGFLCVLDGVRVIEELGEKGDLELLFVKNGKKVLLNPTKGELLHDIFKGEIE